MARPTKYKEEYNEQAYELCLMGCTDAELGEAFGVDESTINNWKNKYLEFLESIRKGKAPADAKVTAAMFKRATGYEFVEKKIAFIDGKSKLVDVTKHFPPDTNAGKFWLKNRQPKKWRDKQELELGGGINVSLQLSDAKTDPYTNEKEILKKYGLDKED